LVARQGFLTEEDDSAEEGLKAGCGLIVEEEDELLAKGESLSEEDNLLAEGDNLLVKGVGLFASDSGLFVDDDGFSEKNAGFLDNTGVTGFGGALEGTWWWW
jgi:hypothetical protein